MSEGGATRAAVDHLPAEPVGDTVAPDGRWHRTDLRMVLLTVATRVASLAVPVVYVVLRIGERDDGRWQLVVAVAGAALAIGSSVASWHATRYRLDDERLQVRRGVLRRTVLTAPLDRVRSVDLEAPLLHRALGLAKVTIGTGTDGDRITLDSLRRDRSAQLRAELLRRATELPAISAVPADGSPQPEVAADRAGGPDGGAPLARMDAAWVRFAPTAAVGGAVALAVAATGLWWLNRGNRAGRWVVDALPDSPALLVTGAALVLLVGGSVAATGSWLSRWWGLDLRREHGGTLHLTRGLLTRTSTTVDESRVRGVQLDEPFAARPLHGAELRALTTGVGSGGTVQLLPRCPRDVAVGVAQALLGPATGEDPMTCRTRGHGPAAHRRLRVGAVLDTAVLTGIGAAVGAWQGWDRSWLALAAPLLLALLALADVEHRTRGHALTAEHVVVTSGRLRRRRVVLQTAGVIGWTVQQSVLQRRLGLATLTVTTAAGPESVEIGDVPVGDALALAVTATPDVWVGALRAGS